MEESLEVGRDSPELKIFPHGNILTISEKKAVFVGLQNDSRLLVGAFKKCCHWASERKRQTSQTEQL